MPKLSSALAVYVVLMILIMSGYFYGIGRQGVNLDAFVMKFARLIPTTFVLLIVFIFYRQSYQKHQIEWLAHHGQKITAHITSVRERTHVRMNYRSPWVIFAEWEDPASHRLYTFRSSDMMFDPTPRLHDSTISVYIDPQDPTRYVVDLVPLYQWRPEDTSSELQKTKLEIEQLQQQVADLEKKRDQK